jgi:hypothetical protein
MTTTRRESAAGGGLMLIHCTGCAYTFSTDGVSFVSPPQQSAKLTSSSNRFTKSPARKAGLFVA